MAYLKLYRDFYCINISTLSGETYTPIFVENISGYVTPENSTSIVESPNIINEYEGRYYVELNPGLYNIDDVYEMNWIVKYISESPEKRLITRFKFIPIMIGQNIDIRLDNQEIRLEIVNN